MLLKIKEFADFSDISVRALHLYDRLGLLAPAQVDSSNGYRYYDSEQMKELNTIISFKKLGFSLADIKDLKADSYSKEAVIKKLQEKKAENDHRIQILAYNNENIYSMLSHLEAEPEKPGAKEEAYNLSRIYCLENDKLEHDFSDILWL
jgi:DNA-binding transcriptional MerR regulator